MLHTSCHLCDVWSDKLFKKAPGPRHTVQIVTFHWANCKGQSVPAWDVRDNVP
jgi:hypothetical protein